MKNFSHVPKTVVTAITVFLLFHAHAEVLIDSFDTTQSAPGGSRSTSVASGPGIIGTERDIDSFLTLSANGSVPGQLQVSYLSFDLNGPAGGDLTYDGPDGTTVSSSFGGLGSIDLTQGGLNDRFRFSITSSSLASAHLTLDCASFSHVSTIDVLLPHTTGNFDILFSQLHGENPFAPVDFHNIGYINVHFGMNSGDSITIDKIAAVPEPAAATIAALGVITAISFCRRRK
jgi:hypothetical protein